ncbi:MAG: DNA-directed RNA polymerase subunit H [Candidatus Methanolliviera hydrocarbonicum]|uniref:DNA-directed RNA polymerase subunit Rpo5 n=1 Tax=Candidatus Methanolliviera hydrocarbonicum TaxID=2491085 RepID=A0A520KXE3_9EURY|nr:MAG: DNA-directed RNA polymerase subunit H [Candidatus Methanolliviera hydrocarbonicum]
MGKFNLFDHDLVPKHILLNEEEAEELLNKYDIEREMLPKIKESDPAAKEIGAKPGDIIKIIRESYTAGETEFYRIVIE